MELDRVVSDMSSHGRFLPRAGFGDAGETAEHGTCLAVNGDVSGGECLNGPQKDEGGSL